MKAYSVDLRTKIVESVRRRDVSISETARRFGVNCSTIGRYLKRLDENGALAPKKAPGSPPKFDTNRLGQSVIHRSGVVRHPRHYVGVGVQGYGSEANTRSWSW